MVVWGGAGEMYHPLCEYLKTNGSYHVVVSQDYTSKNMRGTETWQLYQREHPLAAHPPAAADSR